MATVDIAVDGETTIGGGVFFDADDWGSSGWLPFVDLNASTAGPHRANLFLSGSDWHIVTFRVSFGDGIFANFTDANTGSDRRIDQILLAEGGGSIALGATRVKSIFGGESSPVTITLGSEEVETVRLGDGNNQINVGASAIDSLRAEDGNDRLTITSGFSDTVNLRGGNNRVEVGSGQINSLRTDEGNDTVVVNGGSIEYANLREGTNTVTLTEGGQINTFRSDEGSTTVTMQGESRMFLMKMDRGTNTITTGEGFIEAFYSHEGTNTLNIGAGGGIATMTFSGSNQQQVIRAEGYVGGILAFDDIRVDAVLNGGADSVRLGGGNDRLRTGDDYVGMVNTGRGNDNVSIGSGGAGFVRLGDGDDTIAVVPHVPQNGIHIQGGSGIDTVDLSRFGGAVTARLDEYGTWQDVGGGDGYLAFTEIENLIGGIRADSLTGNDDANVLTGGKGNDTLTGLGGNDTFVFNRTSGRDTVTDFAAGEDLIRIAGASGLGALGFRTVGDDVLISFGTARILVEDITVAELRSVDNFMF